MCIPGNLPEVAKGKAAAMLSKAGASGKQIFGQCFGSSQIKLKHLVPKQVTLGTNDYAHIGIVGGMGTLAGIELHKSIMDKAYVDLEARGKPMTDQNLPKTSLLSAAPEIQDRTAYINAHGVANMSPEEKSIALQEPRNDNALFGILATINNLRTLGAKVYVVPCNTAHAWSDFYKKAAGDMAHVHIVDAALNSALKNDAIKAKVDNGEAVRIGLLATTGTVKNRIYHDRLEKLKKEDTRLANFEFVTPSEDVQEGLVMMGIYDGMVGVKANNLDDSKVLMELAAKKLLAEADEAGTPIDALSLSCTEIPIVLKEGDITTAEGGIVPMIDASDALAQAALEKSRQIRDAEKAAN